LIECYYVTEEYSKLLGLVEVLPEGSPLLPVIAIKAQSVGLTDGASQAYLRAGDVKGAMDCCVALNQWDRAIDLAEKHKMPQIEGLLSRYATVLLEGGKTIAAIELYRKANRDAESAKLLAKLAAEAGKTRVNPLRAKKLYVLAALEVEKHRRRTMDLSSMAAAMTATSAGGIASGATRTAAAAAATAATLNTLMKADAEAGSLTGAEAAAARTLDAAWHGAEAYHFFMLAQRQLYEGNVMAAMTTAQRLALYEDMVDARDIYCIMALTAFYANCLGTCSKAFIKLEAMESLTPAEREAFGDVALTIFASARPVDPPEAGTSVPCPSTNCRQALKPWALNCMSCGANFPACVASGRPIFSAAGGAPGGPDVYRCKVCRHRSYRAALTASRTCPLCHTPLIAETAPASVGGGGGGGGGEAVVGAAAGGGGAGRGAGRNSTAGKA